MSEKSLANCNDSGNVRNAAEYRKFEEFMRTNPDADEIQARYPTIDAEFLRQVDEFIERYRPALEELAQR